MISLLNICEGLSTTKGILNRGSKAIKLIWGLYLLAIVAMTIALPPFLNYSLKRDYSIIDLCYFSLAALVGIGLFFCFRFFSEQFSKFFHNRKAFYVILSFSTIILIALQAAIVRGAWFETGWDVHTLCDFKSINNDYYSRYPNQLLLAGLFRRIAETGKLIGFDNGYLCVVSIGCLCVSISILLASLSAEKLGGVTAGYAVLFLSFIFIGLSPWILVPYSDTYGMLFTTVILFSYIWIKKPIARWPIILFFAVVGYQIKPTVVFLVVAIVFFETIASIDWLKTRLLSGKRTLTMSQSFKRATNQIVLTGGLCVISVVLALATTGSIKNFGVEIDDDKAFGIPHFLMMGMNTEGLSTGTWNRDDVVFSSSFPTVQERASADYQRFKSRMEKAGFQGIALLLVKKVLINYADGTFCWEGEGGFYEKVHGNNALLKRIYGIDENGKDFTNNLFSEPFQIIWFLVLIGCLFASFSSDNRKELAVICLALLFLSLFLMIFECRSRYLFLYAPSYIILGVIGWKHFRLSLCKRSIFYPWRASRAVSATSSQMVADSPPTRFRLSDPSRLPVRLSVRSC